MDKSQEYARICKIAEGRLKTIRQLQDDLNQANATIRDMEEEYRQLHEQYTIMNMAYEATMKAIRG